MMTSKTLLASSLLAPALKPKKMAWWKSGLLYLLHFTKWILFLSVPKCQSLCTAQNERFVFLDFEKVQEQEVAAYLLKLSVCVINASWIRPLQRNLNMYSDFRQPLSLNISKNYHCLDNEWQFCIILIGVYYNHSILYKSSRNKY